MAIKTFKVGKLQVDSNDVGEVDNMALNITIDAGDTTAIGDTWAAAIPLGKAWNVSGSLKYDPDDTAQAALQQEFIAGDGALADVRVYEDGSKYYSGAGIITAYNINKAVGAVDTLSITIQGTGALSYT